jgi:hypothetical protein
MEWNGQSPCEYDIDYKLEIGLLMLVLYKLSVRIYMDIQ